MVARRRRTRDRTAARRRRPCRLGGRSGGAGRGRGARDADGSMCSPCTSPTATRSDRSCWGSSITPKCSVHRSCAPSVEAWLEALVPRVTRRRAAAPPARARAVGCRQRRARPWTRCARGSGAPSRSWSRTSICSSCAVSTRTRPTSSSRPTSSTAACGFATPSTSRGPLRLTPDEGLALLAKARTLLAVPGTDPSGPLARGLAKLAQRGRRRSRRGAEDRDEPGRARGDRRHAPRRGGAPPGGDRVLLVRSRLRRRCASSTRTRCSRRQVSGMCRRSVTRSTTSACSGSTGSTAPPCWTRRSAAPDTSPDLTVYQPQAGRSPGRARPRARGAVGGRAVPGRGGGGACATGVGGCGWWRASGPGSSASCCGSAPMPVSSKARPTWPGTPPAGCSPATGLRRGSAGGCGTLGLPVDTPPDPREHRPAPDADDEAIEQRPSTLRSVVEWVLIVAGAVLVAIVIRTFVLQAFYIPSASMEPTLTIDDKVLVNKLSYKVPRHQPRRHRGVRTSAGGDRPEDQGPHQAGDRAAGRHDRGARRAHLRRTAAGSTSPICRMGCRPRHSPSRPCPRTTSS